MIKFLDLKKINEPYERAFQEKLQSVLETGWYVLGTEVTTFENHFCPILWCSILHWRRQRIGGFGIDFQKLYSAWTFTKRR